MVQCNILYGAGTSSKNFKLTDTRRPPSHAFLGFDPHPILSSDGLSKKEAPTRAGASSGGTGLAPFSPVLMRLGSLEEAH